jgi:hypothetical protein
MSNHKHSTDHATELFIEDLGRVTGGKTGVMPTREGFESGNAPATTAFTGEEGGTKLPNLPNLPNLPCLTNILGENPGMPITQMAGEGGGGPMKL